MDANEFLKGFENDPNYQKKSAEREAKLEEKSGQIKIVEQEFITAWKSKGYPEINSTDDIKGFKKNLNVEQVDFVLKWIPRVPNTFGSQEMLVRALILAAKPFDGKILMALFDDPESSFYLKWAIGNTIDSTKVQNVTHWLKKKFESLSLGKEKEMLVCALGKYLDTDEAKEYLVKVFDTYPLHAADTLAKIGDRSDLDFLLNKLASYKGPGRASISKSVKKLEKKLFDNGL